MKFLGWSLIRELLMSPQNESFKIAWVIFLCLLMNTSKGLGYGIISENMWYNIWRYNKVCYMKDHYGGPLLFSTVAFHPFQENGAWTSSSDIQI